jgi:PII-like signaling protein
MPPQFDPIADAESSGGLPRDRSELPEEAVLLRIFIGEDDRYQRLPLYEAIVLKARAMHLAGATVLRGFLGFGKSSRMHTEKILRLSMDLPMVVEIVDSREKLQAFVPYLESMMSGGLVTLESARVIRRKVDGEKPKQRERGMAF